MSALPSPFGDMVLSLLSVVATLVAPAPPAIIEPGRGIGGIRLGMDERTVRERLGDPDRIRGDHVLVYDRHALSVQTLGAQGSVRRVRTTAQRYRTNGVGVGSHVRSVLRNVPRVRCDRVSCVVATRFGGARIARVTTFALRRSRVTAVTVARGPIRDRRPRR